MSGDQYFWASEKLGLASVVEQNKSSLPDALKGE